MSKFLSTSLTAVKGEYISLITTVSKATELLLPTRDVLTVSAEVYVVLISLSRQIQEWYLK
jgi:hypothetical protein